MADYYVEIPTEEEIGDYTDDLSASDFFLIMFIGIAFCLLLGFICNQLKGTFKKVKFNIGDKVNIELETKEQEKKEKCQKKIQKK